MSHWLVRSVLALLCLFGTGLTSALAHDLGAAPAATSMTAAQEVAYLPAAPSAPPAPDTPAGDTALVDSMLERGDVKNDSTTLDNVDLASSITLGCLERDAPGTPHGREGPSLPSPYLSKLRRPPRG